jgi:HAD superfamily hydrolase (TIGR01549 family)
VPTQAVIFDLDGTITQSFLDFDAIRREIGMAVEGEPILEAMACMDAAQLAYTHRILAVHEERAVAASELNDGAAELLALLQTRGIPVGILTRNKRENAQAVAAKHGLRFNAIVGRDDAPVKPDPTGVFMLCKRFGACPTQTVVVGDYLFDVLCANAAGATSVLLDIEGKAREFAQHADFTVENLGQLVDIIDRC